MKYFLLYSMKNKLLSPFHIYNVMTTAIRLIGEKLTFQGKWESLDGLDTGDAELSEVELTDCVRKKFQLKEDATRFITEFYDDRDEIEKDIWHAANIPGAKLSATMKRQKPTMHFENLPMNYKNSIKRFMFRLVNRRSWSYCTELLIYIRYFYKSFYEHGYEDGFQEKLSRPDMERYLGWVAEDYKSNNATFRSKAVSFIRTYLDYIQLAEYPQAPKKELNRLVFDDDIPRRERASDTMEKVKYIPEPVKIQLDATINEMKPQEMLPVYVLLRETGWRGTDVLNLRYDSCLEYVWNKKDEKYIAYLCSEITKLRFHFLKFR